MDVADPNSEDLILYLDHPHYTNHNGGQLAFGPDGYLYIATGDGGGGGDPFNNAQSPDSLLGKILRIDVETFPQFSTKSHLIFLPLVMGGNGLAWEKPYLIPPDNPFVDTLGFRDEIWVLGMRNPWRFSFDRSTGGLFIGDVGQGSWEEVDFQPATSPGGENYGWNEMEGTHCYLANCDTTGKTLPVFEYPTHVNDSCSVTGGFVYRGNTYPNMNGIYIFGDYCSGAVSGLQIDGKTWRDQLLLQTNFSISTFGEDEAGEIYLADLSGGTIYQIIERNP
ncbi:PQQ-dependent sugar dehydrogenase [Chloroflexota bacterium]